MPFAVTGRQLRLNPLGRVHGCTRVTATGTGLVGLGAAAPRKGRDSPSPAGAAWGYNSRAAPLPVSTLATSSPQLTCLAQITVLP